MSSTTLRCTLAVALLAASLSGCDRSQNNPKLIAQARQYQQRGETRAAVIQLKNVLQKEPNNAVARVLLGDLYMEGGDVMSAEKEYRRARQAGIADGEILPRLGKSLLLQGQYEQMLTDLPADTRQPEILALRAGALLGSNRRDEAERLFDSVLQQQPGLVTALLGKASLAMLANSPARALDLVEQALKQHPDDLDSLRFKGDLLRFQGNKEGARRCYEQILKLRPADFQAHLDLANLLIQADQVSAAQAEIAAARKAAPGNLLSNYTQALLELRQKKYSAALEQVQLVLRGAPDHMPAVLLAGTVQVALKADTQAEQYLKRFLAASPKHLYASKLMAGIALRKGKPDDALYLLSPLADRYPDDVELLSDMGDAYMRKRQFAKATEYFQKAADLAPDVAPLHAALGASQFGMGDSRRAIAELERATSLDAKAPRPATMLVLMQMRAREFGKALATVQALEKQDNNPALQNLKGGVMLASADLPGARTAFEAALKLDAGYLPALENLAQLDLLQHQPEQARSRLEAALARDQKNAALMTALAKLATAQGKPAEAMRWLERAHRDNPDALPPALLLATYYVRAGEKQKALTLAQKIQAGNPSQPDALMLLAQAQAASGNQQAALESYMSLAALLPNSASIQLQIAGTQMALARQPEALAAARKALALQPDYGLAQLTAVRLLTEKNAWPDALAIAQSAQKLHPEAPLGYRLEGDILMAQNRAPQAVQRYEQAYGLGQSGALAIALHRALTQAGRQKDAAARIGQWLQRNPRDVATRLYFASTLVKSDVPAAIAQYEKIVELEPSNALALNELAWSCQLVKDKRALDYAERAYRLAGDNPAILDTLGWILLEQGQTTRALPLLKKASDAAPAASDIRYHYALTLLKAADKNAARRQLDLLLTAKDFTRQDEVRALLRQL
ncbi:MAG: XrtA/PEP-CTERM system TPR-repeat protein PrsT [Pseudomonadota bacterium]